MRIPLILFALGCAGITLLAGFAFGTYIVMTELVCEGAIMDNCTHR